MVGIERIRNSLTLNKPLYAGFAVLELSKLHMYKFHYRHVKQIYGERAELLFTDTDSLTYQIFTEDIYEDMKNHMELYDTSDYPPNHPLHSTMNKQKIGCLRDELSTELALQFIGLRAKMYSILSTQGEKKTAKGVSRTVIRKKVKHQNYKRCSIQQQSDKGGTTPYS